MSIVCQEVEKERKTWWKKPGAEREFVSLLGSVHWQKGKKCKQLNHVWGREHRDHNYFSIEMGQQQNGKKRAATKTQTNLIHNEWNWRTACVTGEKKVNGITRKNGKEKKFLITGSNKVAH